MPRVGDQHFPYTEDGRRQAEEYAAMTGQTVEEFTPPTLRRPVGPVGGMSAPDIPEIYGSPEYPGGTDFTPGPDGVPMAGGTPGQQTSTGGPQPALPVGGGGGYGQFSGGDAVKRRKPQTGNE